MAATLDRSDAVIMARDTIEYDHQAITPKGLRTLAYAVLSMDKYICDLESKIIRQTSAAIREGSNGA